jgi:hypothetical protein
MMLSLDHRWGRRRVTDAQVRFFAQPGTFGMGRVTNVSVTGAFLETAVNLPLETTVHVESLETVNNTARRRMVGNVVRRSEKGVGIEWAQAASNAVLYTQFGAAYRDRADFSRPAFPAVQNSEMYFYQFDFND